jgi:hypothetical protein
VPSLRDSLLVCRGFPALTCGANGCCRFATLIAAPSLCCFVVPAFLCRPCISLSSLRLPVAFVSLSCLRCLAPSSLSSFVCLSSLSFLCRASSSIVSLSPSFLCLLRFSVVLRFPNLRFFIVLSELVSAGDYRKMQQVLQNAVAGTLWRRRIYPLSLALSMTCILCSFVLRVHIHKVQSVVARGLGRAGDLRRLSCRSCLSS